MMLVKSIALVAILALISCDKKEANVIVDFEIQTSEMVESYKIYHTSDDNIIAQNNHPSYTKPGAKYIITGSVTVEKNKGVSIDIFREGGFSTATAIIQGRTINVGPRGDLPNTSTFSFRPE